jgi:hypothetical protein
MTEQTQVTAAANPANPGGPATATPLPAKDAGLGVALRTVLVVVVALCCLELVTHWVPTTDPLPVLPLAIVAILAVAGYAALAGGWARPDGPRTAVEIVAGAAIAFGLAWSVSLVPPPPPAAEPGAPVTPTTDTIRLDLPLRRVKVGDPTLADDSGPIKGVALVVVLTRDKDGVESRTTQSIEGEWERAESGYTLRVKRGEGDADALAAAAAIEGAEVIWLLPKAP